VAYLLATNVAIHLRDGDATISAKIAALDDAILLSIVTRVELEGGVYCDAAHALVHRATLVTMNPADFRDIAGLEMLVW